MKIALLGYGRMGKEIEKIALQRGHEIVIKYSGKENYNIKDADVAIDFSIPTIAYDNITNCLTNNIPVVSGTTGWLDNYDDVVKLCNDNKGGFIYASNFSLGVNIFFELNKQLAKMMKNLEQYTTSIEEIHHTKKLDAPSGTAITLAEDIINNSLKNTWTLDGDTDNNNIPITAIRTPDVPGTHTTSYQSIVDSIDIKHTAHNRQGFALGAVIAAEWLVDKTGVFSMKDVLNLG
ncbi:dihydrodipicolinate reductase [Tenacibaculum sp. MAR_2009_124]|uniref:4-hydroxy-tetrahydrodipicolinate reductase n=1 Tax=Tenacibaculum sp. MAR_2009_124 TaxID=1250059 RepID=UPI00089A2AA3|nr:4-hydroxy-tetrahydrodipicolinate reductase [Tenacibaculum sp. MAR_2009_124]SEC90089.1 dihydrodipicolinate reductase [Tenacibaculum sp. MAR_2009_124]